MAEDLDPVRRTPLYEEIAERLRALVAAQGLAAGTKLPSERELSQRLGVSRTSVRQALASLRAIGVVEVRHGDGTYLVRPGDELVEPLSVEVLHASADHPMVWEAREAVEVHAARLAAIRATDADIAGMREALSAMERAIRAGDDGAAEDADFHAAVVRAAHNPLLAELFASMAESVARTSAASLSVPGRPPESLRAHQSLVEAIGDRDPERAAGEMTSHVRRSARATTWTPS